MRATGWLHDDLLQPVRRHLARGMRRRLPEGTSLIVAGEPVQAFGYIETGLIQSTLLRPDGEHLIVERIGPGSICGEGPALHGEPPAVEMVALEPTEVVLFERTLIQQLFREDAEFAQAIARILSIKYHRLLDRFGAVADRRPSERLLELLNRLGRLWGEPHSRGRLIRTSLTHEDMAAMTGLSRVTVTRGLAGLKRAGRIDVVDGSYLLVGD